MLKRFCWFASLLVSGFFPLFGQMVFIHPPYPGINDSISIYFNAESGNQALKDAGENVYLHTGVILGPDSLNSTWYYIQGEWAQHDQYVLMEKVGPNLYRKKVHIKTYYHLPPDLEVNRLAFVFRNKDGSKVGTPEGEEEVWYSLRPPIPVIKEDSVQQVPEIFKPLSILQLAKSDSLSNKLYQRKDTLLFNPDLSLENETMDLTQLVSVPALVNIMHKRKNTSVDITRKDSHTYVPPFLVFRMPERSFKQVNLNNDPLLEVNSQEDLVFWENSYLIQDDLLFIHLDMNASIMSLTIKF